MILEECTGGEIVTLFRGVSLSELVKLLETMLVDQLLKRPVRVVAYLALVVENHEVAVFRRIRFPFGETFGVGVTGMGESRP